LDGKVFASDICSGNLIPTAGSGLPAKDAPDRAAETRIADLTSIPARYGLLRHSSLVAITTHDGSWQQRLQIC
jgi:hypothetical protein